MYTPTKKEDYLYSADFLLKLEMAKCVSTYCKELRLIEVIKYFRCESTGCKLLLVITNEDKIYVYCSEDNLKKSNICIKSGFQSSRVG